VVKRRMKDPYIRGPSGGALLLHIWYGGGALLGSRLGERFVEREVCLTSLIPGFFWAYFLLWLVQL